MLLTNIRSQGFAERIRDAVEGALTARNISARRASMDVVGHDGLIRDIRAGRIPSADRIEALFDYLGLEAYFGPKRDTAEQLMRGNIEPDEEAPSGFFTIPLLGAESTSSTAPMAFSRKWLEGQRLVPDFLKAVTPDTFAINPPPARGSIALVTTNVARREGTALWCYKEAGKFTVANMTFVDDIAVVHPPQPDDDAQVFRGRSSVVLGLLGKVVWIGQTIAFKGNID